jgi:putative ABC transport system substrate-binding protein
MLHALYTHSKKPSILFLLSLIFGLSTLSHAENAPSKTIAITQIVGHASLDKVRQGITDELAASGYQDGKSAHIIFQNAQGSIVVASQIAQRFVTEKPDVIIAIATPSAQAAVNAAKKTNIPVVFATITDPIQAKLVTNLEHPNGNVTGTRNITAVTKQLAQIKQLLPQVKTIGIVLNYGEANSVQLLHTITEDAAKMNITVKSAAAPSSAEVQAATQSLMGQVDALLLLQDNTVASALPAVLKVSAKNNTPVFSTFIDGVKNGALAGVAYDEYAIGKKTGKIVVDILHGKKPGDIAVADPSDVETAVNLNTAKELHLNVSKEALKQFKIVYPTAGN